MGKNSMTLKKLLTITGTTHIDILKMDIEGGEYEIIPELLGNHGQPIVPVCHFLLEMHWDKRLE